MNEPDSPEFTLPKEDEQSVALALAEYVDLLSNETPVDVDAFCKQYPKVEADLRRAIATLGEFDVLTEDPSLEEAEGLPEPEIEMLSGHRILGEIGSGGMGRVFLAMDQRLGRRVAIKTLKAQWMNDPALRARFMREARAMARISHPNIVQIYGLGEPDEIPHFVMEYLDGRPLNEVTQPLPLRQKMELMHKVVMAVDFLHQRDLIHRDLKPANILIGADLDPKLLDFGLALHVTELKQRVTSAGAIVGTPDYLSPEQARGDASLDPRSDVFSLGTVLYQVLTGCLPFHGETPFQLAGAIRDQEPVLPRRLSTSLPRALQNICLKALEKDPKDRYNSALEMAQDIERYLAGEEVLALPTSYSRLIAGRIERHLRELDGWKLDQVISDSEYDSLRAAYSRLTEPEDAWIMQARRLSLSQVSLYLGAWLLVMGAALVFLFQIPALSGKLSILVVGAAVAVTAALGIRTWRQKQYRFAIAFLLAFCLLFPLALLVGMGEFQIFAAFTRGREDLELFHRWDLFRKTTNLQLWWAVLMSLPVYVWLRTFTRSSVFSLVFAAIASLFSLTTLLRFGMLDWIDNDPGRTYLYLIPIAAIFFTIAVLLERLGRLADSRYFYPFAVCFAFAGLSGVAVFHDPYAKWLQSVAPWTRGQIEYLFILNAAIYLVLQTICKRVHSSQLRTVARTFRFVIPGHIMTSLLLLGIEASRLWTESPGKVAMQHEARIFEVLLPMVACVFVFSSIPEQMKNYFASGLVFLAIGIVRLQQDYFKDLAGWPVALLTTGTILMLCASWYLPLRKIFSGRLQWRISASSKKNSSKL
ncbi:MAG TPA: serine/threonine-protein kinase [Terracidiphilus sp.]|jgi:serine/threonine-protein kinase